MVRLQAKLDWLCCECGELIFNIGRRQSEKHSPLVQRWALKIGTGAATATAAAAVEIHAIYLFKHIQTHIQTQRGIRLRSQQQSQAIIGQVELLVGSSHKHRHIDIDTRT